MYKYKLSLRRVFTDFDKDVKKGQMTFEEFKVFLQKISKDITSEEAL
jgi:Ca2+-binding EF-hand superfamily protein